MQFALVNNERVTPSRGLAGACPACGSVMIAKCGKRRMHHWAHRGIRSCDVWWEPETPWHRQWKSLFPKHWQEVRHLEASGEIHISDVHTEHGLTMEFQHSRLNVDERSAREKFYPNMVWVVDGARLKRDFTRLVGSAHSFRTILANGRPIVRGLYFTRSPERAFPPDWINCNAPVFFDFANAACSTQEFEHMARALWGLLPKRVGGQAVVLIMAKDVLVNWAHSKEHQAQMEQLYEIVERSLMIERLWGYQIAARQRQNRLKRALRRYPKAQTPRQPRFGPRRRSKRSFGF